MNKKKRLEGGVKYISLCVCVCVCVRIYTSEKTKNKK